MPLRHAVWVICRLLPKSQPPQPWMYTYFWCVVTCRVPIIWTEKYMKTRKNRQRLGWRLAWTVELGCLCFSDLKMLTPALSELHFNNLQSIIKILQNDIISQNSSFLFISSQQPLFVLKWYKMCYNL